MFNVEWHTGHLCRQKWTGWPNLTFLSPSLARRRPWSPSLALREPRCRHKTLCAFFCHSTWIPKFIFVNIKRHYRFDIKIFDITDSPDNNIFSSAFLLDGTICWHVVSNFKISSPKHVIFVCEAKNRRHDTCLSKLSQPYERNSI